MSITFKAGFYPEIEVTGCWSSRIFHLWELSCTSSVCCDPWREFPEASLTFQRLGKSSLCIRELVVSRDSFGIKGSE